MKILISLSSEKFEFDLGPLKIRVTEKEVDAILKRLKNGQTYEYKTPDGKLFYTFGTKLRKRGSIMSGSLTSKVGKFVYYTKEKL